MKKKLTRNRVAKYPIIVQFWTAGNMKETLKAIAKSEKISLSALLRNLSEAAINEYLAYRIEQGNPLKVDSPKAELVQ